MFEKIKMSGINISNPFDDLKYQVFSIKSMADPKNGILKCNTLSFPTDGTIVHGTVSNTLPNESGELATVHDVSNIIPHNIIDFTEGNLLIGDSNSRGIVSNAIVVGTDINITKNLNISTMILNGTNNVQVPNLSVSGSLTVPQALSYGGETYLMPLTSGRLALTSENVSLSEGHFFIGNASSQAIDAGTNLTLVTNILTAPAISCSSILSSGTLSTGTFSMTCGSLSVSSLLSSGTLSIGTNAMTCGSLSVSSLLSSGTLSTGTFSMTCGSLSVSSVLSSGTISAGTNAMTCGNLSVSSVLSSGTLSIGTNAMTCGNLSVSSVLSSGTLSIGTNAMTCGNIISTTDNSLTIGSISASSVLSSGTLSIGTNSMTCGTINVGTDLNLIGNLNIDNINYTSNVKQYMKRSVRLFALGDFVPHKWNSTTSAYDVDLAFNIAGTRDYGTGYGLNYPIINTDGHGDEWRCLQTLYGGNKNFEFIYYAISDGTIVNIYFTDHATGNNLLYKNGILTPYIQVNTYNISTQWWYNYMSYLTQGYSIGTNGVQYDVLITIKNSGLDAVKKYFTWNSFIVIDSNIIV